MNLSLFEEEKSTTSLHKIGQTQVSYTQASSILTKSNGFLSDFDYSLNPYSGCAFGCHYCYAAFFTNTSDKKENWGYWLQVKENALALLKKKRKKPLIDKVIYMSSVTDPYQPVEKTIELSRSLLKELADYHAVKLVIQTRSPLVCRDMNLLQAFKFLQVNMTITTDDEKIRKAFEPLCPSNTLRIKAIQKIHEAGLNACITMTPLLPLKDPLAFAKRLKETGIQKFVVQGFHLEKGKFVANTGQKALGISQELGWDEQKYQDAIGIFKEHLPHLKEGKEGFKPDFGE